MPNMARIVLYGSGVNRVRLPMTAYRVENYTAAGGFTVVFGVDGVREVTLN